MRMQFLIVLGTTLAVSAGAYGGSDEAGQDLIEALRSEVANLRMEVAEMKAQDGDTWLTEQRASEVRQIVEEVLADADSRASLLQGGLTAGWDKNFYLQSADGDWRMRFRGQIQTRWAWNHATGADPADLYGFEVRRAKLKFDGHVIDGTWKYVVNLSSDYDSAVRELEVEDAFIIKEFDNGLAVWAGQFKDFFMREELVSSSGSLTVDRSYVNELFNQDRTVGVALVYTGDRFRIDGSYTNGFDKRQSFLGTPTGTNSVTARVEWLAAGSFSQFKDLQGWRGGEFGALVGGAINYQKDKYSAAFSGNPGGRVQRITWTIDGSIEGDGWNVLAYVVGNHLSFGSGAPSADQFGVVIQGGYMLNDQWDIFANLSWWDLDGNSSTSVSSPAPISSSSIVSIGTNYYIQKNTVKWTTDVGVGLDSIPITELGIDWRADAPGQDGQVVVRSQLQLLF